jgi:DivIVA domain-containing protein
MSAETIASRRFAQSWRGYDPAEVQQFLAQVSEVVRSLKERYERAEAARREAEQRASHPEMDEAALMAAVGEETAAILRSAKSAAAEITAKAQAAAEATVAAAEARAAQLVAEAESLLAARTAEADAAAAEIGEAAAADALRTREAAERHAREIEEEASRKCDEALESAQAMREKVLADLARRRKVASVQIEQLRAGRERLLEAYLVVRRTLDEVTSELQRADAEARAAAEAVGRQHSDDELAELHDPIWPPLEAAEGQAEAAIKPAQMAPHPAKTAEAGRAEAGRAEAGHAEEPKVAAPKAAQLASLPGEALLGPRDSVESVRILRQAPPEAAPEQPSGEGGSEGAGSAHVAAAENGDRTGQHDVQSLFARIRAGREEAATAARKALKEAPEGQEGSLGAAGGAAGSQEGAASTDGGEDGQGSPEGLFAERDKVLTRLEASLARRLKRVLQDEQNSLLDRLRSLKVPAVTANLLPSAEAHPDRFAEAGRPFLEEAARAGSELVGQAYGLGQVQAGLDAEALDDLAEELGKAITGPLRQRLELALASSSEEAAELADALASAYREWKTQRIEAAARDQVIAAFSQGAYLALPQGSLLRWVASRAPCPDCEDNALAGEQQKGEPWPTGQLHPPAHPGCSCALLLATSAASAGAATAPAKRAAPTR